MMDELMKYYNECLKSPSMPKFEELTDAQLFAIGLSDDFSKWVVEQALYELV